jgi:catechol 2,3-dioxygenase-like lactoylglutathione lyase family enzyme
MFKHARPFGGFSTNDLAKAKTFYQDKLGLGVVEGPMGILELQLGDGHRIIIYPKENHQPASFTILNFPVKNIEEAVKELNAKGVEFIKYPPPYATDDKGIFRGGGPLIAWFEDPAGNILSIIEDPNA